MSSLAVVAEGLGDVSALPALIAKTATAFGSHAYASHVVRAGGWTRLRQPGQIERFCRLAGSHSGVDAILVITDLDDGCAKRENEAIAQRIENISELLKLPVRVCFCVREFEAWLLEGFDHVKEKSPEISWVGSPPSKPSEVRGAKEAFEALLGSKYRETIDQLKFTRRLDPISLYRTSRSFRKFVKVVCDQDYADLSLTVKAYS